jgi:hypothetical protein
MFKGPHLAMQSDSEQLRPGVAGVSFVAMKIIVACLEVPPARTGLAGPVPVRRS